MRRPITLTILAAVLILSAGTTLAKDPKIQQDSPQTAQVPRPLPTRGLAMLQPHPMLVEMQTILREARQKEDDLLKALQAATTEKEMNLALVRLERLDTDKELALLKVQAKYARKLGRYELEREIRHKIVGLLTADTKPIQ